MDDCNGWVGWSTLDGSDQNAISSSFVSLVSVPWPILDQ